MRNSIDVVSSESTADTAEALAIDGVDLAAQVDHPVDRVHAHRRQPPAGVSSLRARASALSASAFGNVMVAST